MKNKIKFLAAITVFSVCLLFALSVSATESVEFKKVQEYNGKVYTCTDTYYIAELNASKVNPLPAGIVNDGAIFKFAVYYDKIYYITAPEGTSDVLGSIYRCNLDGSENSLIANDVEALGNAFLSDGCLFYDIFYDYQNYYGRYLQGGIMKINLNTGAYCKVVTDIGASISNMLDDKMFYWASGGHHLMNTSGAYIGGISANDIEVSGAVILGDKAYKISYGAIYRYDWSHNAEWVASTANKVDGYPTYYTSGTVENVTGGYIYYSVGYSNPNLNMYHAATNTALFRVPINGGTSELISKWYRS